MKDTCDELRALPGWKAIVAMTGDGGIGYQGKIPWHITSDLRLFRQLTLDQNVIAGRTTVESLPVLLRRNVHGLTHSGIPSANQPITWHYGFATLPVTAWVIGGAQIYRQLLPQCTAIVVTQVMVQYEVDTMFPTELLNEFGIRHDLMQDDDCVTSVYFKV